MDCECTASQQATIIMSTGLPVKRHLQEKCDTLSPVPLSCSVLLSQPLPSGVLRFVDTWAFQRDPFDDQVTLQKLADMGLRRVVRNSRALTVGAMLGWDCDIKTTLTRLLSVWRSAFLNSRGQDDAEHPSAGRPRRIGLRATGFPHLFAWSR